MIGVIIAVAVVTAVVAVIKLDATGKKGSGLGDEFLYDLADLGIIDPKLILYKEAAGTVSTGFKNACAVAIDSGGNLYVAGDSAVRIFGKAGTNNTIDLASAPGCVTVSDDGKIFIGLKDHVEVYDAAGKKLAAWSGLGDNAVLTSIAVYRNDVFVADAGNRIVRHYDITGKLVNRIGGKNPDKNIPGFVIPSPYFDLAVAPDGLLRVVNPGKHRIEAYTFDGDLEVSWGKTGAGLDGFCGCCNPINFALLPGGGFVTCEKGLTRVKIFDAQGNFVGAVAGPEQLTDGKWCICETPSQCQVGGFDVAVDGGGRIYVLDTLKNIIRIFDKTSAG